MSVLACVLEFEVEDIELGDGLPLRGIPRLGPLAIVSLRLWRSHTGLRRMLPFGLRLYVPCGLDPPVS